MKSIVDLVDRGLEIDAALAALKAEKKEVDATLIKYALRGDHVNLKDGDLEGKRFIALGTKSQVDVVFTSDRLVQTFQADGVVHQRLITAAGDSQTLAHFYERVAAFKMLASTGKAFRKQAGEILGAGAPALIVAARDLDKHGQPKSETKVLWGDAEPI